MPESRVCFHQLAAQDVALADEIRAAVAAVFDDHAFVLGPAVTRFEEALADYLGVPAFVGTASGTDALYIAVRAAGLGPGDAVLTTPFSFIASAASIARAGVRPYFVDIDPTSFLLDPMAVRTWIERHCRRVRTRLLAPGGERVAAVLPVHLFGAPCAMQAFGELGRELGLDLIEDAAQAIGVRVAGGAAGALGRFGCFSFYPTKNLGGAGDGGGVACPRSEDVASVRSIARHGTDGDPYRHITLGLASRLDAIQAAVLAVKLPHVDAWNAARRANAERYARLFAAGEAATRGVTVPQIVPGHVFHQYVVRVSRRTRVRELLSARGIETQVYYPSPLHLQPCFAELGYEPGAFPEAERASREVLALPMHPGLSEEDARRVVAALLDVTTTLGSS